MIELGAENSEANLSQPTTESNTLWGYKLSERLANSKPAIFFTSLALSTALLLMARTPDTQAADQVTGGNRATPTSVIPALNRREAPTIVPRVGTPTTTSTSRILTIQNVTIDGIAPCNYNSAVNCLSYSFDARNNSTVTTNLSPGYFFTGLDFNGDNITDTWHAMSRNLILNPGQSIRYSEFQNVELNHVSMNYPLNGFFRLQVCSQNNLFEKNGFVINGSRDCAVVNGNTTALQFSNSVTGLTEIFRVTSPTRR